MRGELGSIDATVYVAIKEFFMHGVNGREESTVTSGGKKAFHDKYKSKFIKKAINLSKLQVAVTVPHSTMPMRLATIGVRQSIPAQTLPIVLILTVAIANRIGVIATPGFQFVQSQNEAMRLTIIINEKFSESYLSRNYQRL